jgi:hypothetical protein
MGIDPGGEANVSVAEAPRHNGDVYASLKAVSCMGVPKVMESKDSKGFRIPKAPSDERPLRVSRVLHDMEAILDRSFPAPGANRQAYFGGSAKVWEQMPADEVRQYRSAMKANRLPRRSSPTP